MKFFSLIASAAALRLQTQYNPAELRCSTCESMFPVVEQQIKSFTDNEERAEFFHTKSNADEDAAQRLFSQLADACRASQDRPPKTRESTWNSYCVSSARAFTQTSTIPQCWTKTDSDSFCGCMAGAPMGRTRGKCSAMGSNRKPKPHHKPEPETPAPQIVWEPQFNTGHLSRREVGCEVCAATWEVFNDGLEAGLSNEERATFFATKTGSAADPKRARELADGIRAECAKYSHTDGASERLWSDACLSLSNRISAIEYAPACWKKQGKDEFCGCMQGGPRRSTQICPGIDGHRGHTHAQGDDAHDYDKPTEHDGDDASTVDPEEHDHDNGHDDGHDDGHEDDHDDDHDDDHADDHEDHEDGHDDHPADAGSDADKPAPKPEKPAGPLKVKKSKEGTRFDRYCQTCYYLFDVIEDGLQLETKQDKADFFATSTLRSEQAKMQIRQRKLRDEMVKQCEARDEKLKYFKLRSDSCENVARAVTRGDVTKCWDYTDAQHFCGCMEGASGWTPKDKVCKAY